MKVNLETKEDLLRELSVEVPAEKVNELVEQKLVEKKKHAEFKGFRKGKAPMDMVKKAYEAEIRYNAAEEILKSTYPEAVKQENLKVASFPQVTKLDYNEEGDLLYTAQVEVFPEIDNVEFDGLELSENKIEVTDEEVESVVENLQKRAATIREVNRPVGDKDVVVVDIDKLEDPGNVVKSDKFENSEVDLGNKLTIKEFKEALPGMSKGDSKEIDVQYADDYPDKTFAGAKLKYKCTIKEVKEQILPELNDAFAKQSGMAETMLELKLKIRENIQAQKEEEQNRSIKSQVIDHVCLKNSIMVPKALVSEYVENVLKDFKEQYKDQKIDEEEIKKSYEPVGQTAIRWNMLMYRLAENEKIEVTPADIEDLVNKFAKNYNITPDQAKQSLQQSGQIANIRESILEDKVVDFIKSKAKIITADN